MSSTSKDLRAQTNIDMDKRIQFIKRKINSMSHDQLVRFEFFVRSHFNKNKIKSMIQNSIGSKFTVSDEMAIIVGSLSKLFVGELMETAIDVWNENPRNDDRIKSHHLEEAYRRLENSGKVEKQYPSDSYMLDPESAIVEDIFDVLFRED